MRAVVLLSMLMTTVAVADDRIDVLYRAKQLCKAEKIPLVTSIHMAAEYAQNPAVYWPDADRIEINLANDFWETAEQRISHGFEDRYYSSGHPDYMIQHEIGHARFYRHVGVKRGLEVLASPFTAEQYKLAKSVSIYAAHDKIELVAEVWAGLAAGRVYSPELMAFYESLWVRGSSKAE